MTFIVQERSAGAVIFRKENNRRLYLLLHYESARKAKFSGTAATSIPEGGHWDFVKGHIEEKESIEDTVRREALEEAGLKDLRFVPSFKEKIHYFFRRGRAMVSKDVFFLLAETKTKDVVLSQEHIGFAWLPFKEAVERVTFETAKSVLKKAEEVLNRGCTETEVSGTPGSKASRAPSGLEKWTSKGISPVIASIILVLVVLSLAGAYSVFTGRVAGTQIKSWQERSQEIVQALVVGFKIEGVEGQDVLIRNVGTETIKRNSLVVLLGDRSLNYTMGNTITKGATGRLAVQGLWRVGPGTRTLKL